jgi:hypothetical protein
LQAIPFATHVKPVPPPGMMRTQQLCWLEQHSDPQQVALAAHAQPPSLPAPLEVVDPLEPLEPVEPPASIGPLPEPPLLEALPELAPEEPLLVELLLAELPPLELPLPELAPPELALPEVLEPAPPSTPPSAPSAPSRLASAVASAPPERLPVEPLPPQLAAAKTRSGVASTARLCVTNRPTLRW